MSTDNMRQKLVKFKHVVFGIRGQADKQRAHRSIALRPVRDRNIQMVLSVSEILGLLSSFVHRDTVTIED